jgi:HK97 family phage major capsid protein
MAYDNILSRSDTSALIPEDVSNAMLQNLEAQSAARRLFRNIPVARNAVRFPVMNALPQAYWVSPTDTGLKQTTNMAWSNVTMNIEELAAIVIVPDSVVDDVSVDIWGQAQRYIEQAIARQLDATVFFGTNKPTSFPDGIVESAVDVGNIVAKGTATQANGGIAQDFNDLFSKVENDGFAVNGVVAKNTLRASMRGARATDGQTLNDVSIDNVYGQPVIYGMDGLWPADIDSSANIKEPVAIAADFSQFVIGIRQDITFSLHRDGVITDNTGAVQFNLMQQDLSAIRVVMRVGWAVANSLNYRNSGDASRFPAAVMTVDTAD